MIIVFQNHKTYQFYLKVSQLLIFLPKLCTIANLLAHMFINQIPLTSGNGLKDNFHVFYLLLKV
jgi:hypothetical protein